MTGTDDAGPPVGAGTGHATDRPFIITNRRGGQLIEITFDRMVPPDEWPSIESRLVALINVRQPRELAVDGDGMGAIDRFEAGLAVIADALAQFGGSLTPRTDRPSEDKPVTA